MLRSRADSPVADEVVQRASVKLLVEGRVADYRGRGSLAAFLRVVLARVAHDLRAAARDRAALLEQLVPEHAAGGELELIKAQYRPAFERALETELRKLPRRARVLLRLHHVEGMGIDQLAAVYHVSRATAARWLVEHRTALRDAIRARLRSELRIDEAELDSLLRLVESQLHLTLSRVLA